MSAQQESPGTEGLGNLDNIGVEGDNGEDSGPGIIALALYYHPLALMGLALAMAITAWAAWPDRVVIEVPKFDILYDEGLASLRTVTDPDQPLSELKIRQSVQVAKVDFESLLKHYEQSLRNYPEYINPYLLYGESLRYHHRYVPRKTEEIAADALWAYSKAKERESEWSDKYRKLESGKDPELALEMKHYFRQLMGDAQSYSDAELAERWRRRIEYIDYQQAVMLKEVGSYTQAQVEFEKILDNYKRRELEKQKAGATHKGMLPPGEFELVREDIIRLHYHLGDIYERQDEKAKASVEYDAFLLEAPRSMERYLAMMRLGILESELGRESRMKAKMQQDSTAGSYQQEAERHFRMAADRFSQIVEASAPGNITTEAYFRGGLAYLAMADTLSLDRKTWWEAISETGESLESDLENFVRPGWRLPDRTRFAPSAIGRLLMDGSFDIPDPFLSTMSGLAGTLLNRSTEERQTGRALREELLNRARSFFEGADVDGPFRAASRVMIGRVLLSRGEFDRARHSFRNTMSKYGAYDAQIACQHGEARSYLLDNELDRAANRLIGGIEREGSAALNVSDIQWRDFCIRLNTEGPGKDPGAVQRVWKLISPEVRSRVRQIAQMFEIDNEHKNQILAELNKILKRSDFYSAGEFARLILPNNARRLLAMERATMKPGEIEWMNRLLLDTAFPHSVTGLSELNTQVFYPMPEAKALPRGLLDVEEELVADLLQLSRAYRDEADAAAGEAMAAARKLKNGDSASPVLRELQRQELIRQRRALESAIRINEFLTGNYRPKAASLLSESAEMHAQLARVIGRFPFFSAAESQEALAKSARTYMRVADIYDPASPREEEALWSAGWAFFAAGQYGRVVEAMNLYLRRHGASNRAGIATNLLGRAYRNLGQYEDAIKTFDSNISRRTPDGPKSIYYLGWVYLQMEKSVADGKEIDRIGDPANSTPIIGDEGGLTFESALQALSRVRRLANLGWKARPWRWATFDLGYTWMLIAERQRKAAKDDDESRKEWLGSYRNAEKLLQEALERYRLRRYGDGKNDDTGGEVPSTYLDWNEEPEDYGEVMAARMVAEYRLARVRGIVGSETGNEELLDSSRKLLRNLLDGESYPDIMFSTSVPRPYYLAWAAYEGSGGSFSAEDMQQAERNTYSALGESEGPDYNPGILDAMRRNAFFLLGKSLFDEGERKSAQAENFAREKLFPERETAVEQSRNSYRRAFAVYQSAYDRLPPRDAPQVLYLMGECLRKLGEVQAAIAKYTLAGNTARNLPELQESSPLFVGPKFWEEMSAQRIGELQRKIGE